MIDTHTHLNLNDYDEDIEAVLKRAKTMGVAHILVIGMDKKANLKAIELSKRFQGLSATIGIHPGSVGKETMDHVRELIKNNPVVAIGECGLDFYWTDENKDEQIQVFQSQIDLAVETGLPLIIHTRNSFDAAYQMLLPYQGKVTGVFHCFSAALEDAVKAVELGFYIGLDGPVTYKKNQELKRIIEHIDLSRLLVETDSPYLAPVPHRGKRNEPSYLVYIIDEIAKIRGVSPQLIKDTTTENAKHLFKLGGLSL